MRTSFRFTITPSLHRFITPFRLWGLALMPAALLACTTHSARANDAQGATEMGNTPRGAMVVETYQRTATITAIDPATRNITLTAPDGTQTIFKAGPEIRNFDQLRVGDKVKATMTDAVAVALRPQGAPPAAGQISTLAIAPKGAKPGVVMTSTDEATAKILAVDPQQRTVTLRFMDGTTRTEKVGKDIDLTGVKPGQEVTVRTAQSVAIRVEKP